MSARARWGLLLALAALGAGALWRWLPESDPLARAHVAVGRAEVLARTRELAQQWGCPVRGGLELVTTKQNSAYLWWQEKVPGASASHLPQGLFTATVRESNGAVTAEYAPDGRLTRFDCAIKTPGPAQAPSAALADSVRQALSQGVTEQFGAPEQTASGQGVTHLTWGLKKNPPGASWNIAADISGTTVRHAELMYALSDDVSQAQRQAAAPAQNLAIVGKFLNYLILLTAPIICVVMLVRGRLNRRFALAIAGACYLSLIPVNFRMEEWAADPSGPPFPIPVMALVEALAVTIQVLCWSGALSLGETLSRRADSKRWRAVRLAAAGKLWSRPVGAALLAGVLGAVALAFIGAPLAASLLFPDLTLTMPGRTRLAMASGSPALFALLPNFSDFSITVFGLIVPCLAGRRRSYSIAGVFAALLIYAAGAPMATGVAAVLVWSVVSLAIGYFIYREFGVLAAILASVLSDCLLHTLRLWNASSPGLHSAGLRGLLVLGGLGVVGLVIHTAGRAVSEEEGVAKDVPEKSQASARELLKSEFSLAHRAQQQMLPTQPPALPGYDFAGLCHPARDVGGDLYDYVRLADGRLGVCVADVSGKGMPAALYMTFTKGLLAAAAQDSGNLADIAKHMNGHLYKAGRRKVFVTAVLGVVDPVTREFEYVRAGHNPVVWRRAVSRETLLLQSPGMGFGVGTSRYFDRSLRPERLTLEVGDALVFYSDGLTEAMNEELEQFGEERLMDCVAQTDGLDAAATRDTILATVRRFLNGVHAQDDLTIVVLRVEAI